MSHYEDLNEKKTRVKILQKYQQSGLEWHEGEIWFH